MNIKMDKNIYIILPSFKQIGTYFIKQTSFDIGYGSYELFSPKL